MFLFEANCFSYTPCLQLVFFYQICLQTFFCFQEKRVDYDAFKGKFDFQLFSNALNQQVKDYYSSCVVFIKFSIGFSFVTICNKEGIYMMSN